MYRTHRRKIVRDILSRKARTALVVISIFIGVLGTVTLFTMGDLFVRQLEEDLKEEELAMTRTYVAPLPAATIDDESNAQTLAALAEVPGLTAVEAQSLSTLFWRTENDDEFTTSSMLSYSVPLSEIQLEPMRKVRGEWPEPGQNQLVVDRRFAAQQDVDVGDEILVSMLSQADPATGTVPEEPWTIVGVVFLPYPYVGGFNNVLPEDLLFAQEVDAQRIAGYAAYSSFYARYDNFGVAEDSEDALAAAFNTVGAYSPIFPLAEDPADNSLIRSARNIGGTMAALALLALIVSGFLVVNVVTAIVTEQKSQIGVMKSIGATRADNFIIYTGIALVYGILAVIPAVLLGLPLGFQAAQGLAGTFDSEIAEFGISTRAIILGVVMGLAVPVIAALIPVFLGTRVRILEALTDLGISGGYGQGFVARVIERLPFPTNIRMGVSNVVRKWGRMAFTTMTLAVAVGAFMGVFAVFESITETLDAFLDTYNTDLGVVPRENQNMEEFQAALLQEFPDLTAQGPTVSVTMGIEGYEKEYDPSTGPPGLFATGYDPTQGAFALKFTEGEGLENNPDDVVISTSIANAIDKGAGDTIVIEATGRTQEFTISGVVTYPYDSVWFDWRTLATFIGSVNEAGDPVAQGIFVRLPDDDATAADVEEVQDRIDNYLQTQGQTANYNNLELFKELISEVIGTFQAIFNSAAFLIALVGALGLLTALSMSVYERQKEIGVMRSIGAGSPVIVSQFLTEGILVGIAAWVLGLPLSYGIARLLHGGLELGEEYQLGFPMTAIVLGFVGMILITTIASIWPSLSAARKTVSDILRYQ